MKIGWFLSLFFLYLFSLSTPVWAQANEPINTYCQATPGTWAPCSGSGGGGSGTVTSVATGTGLTGGPITTTGTVSCVQGSSSVFGCIKVDGSTITATSGVISAVGGSGTVTSISAGCGSSTGGGAITTTGTIAAVLTTDARTTATESITNADCGFNVTFSFNGAVAVTLPQAGSGGNFTSGWFGCLTAESVAASVPVVTITPTTSTIAGLSSVVIRNGQSTCVQSDGTNYHFYVPPNLSAIATDQLLTGGANVVSHSIGTVTSGTTTVDCGLGPLQYYTNGGAHTLAAPATDGSCIVTTTNNGSAGTITFSGFTEGTNKGDALDTTNAHVFSISIYRINSVAHYLVSAYQ